MSGIAFLNHEGRLQLDASMLPGTIAYDRALQEEILRSVHSKFAGRTEPVAQMLPEINQFINAYVCERVYPGFRNIDRVMEAIGGIHQIQPIVMTVDGEDITFSYDRQQPVLFKSDVFIKAISGA